MASRGAEDVRSKAVFRPWREWLITGLLLVFGITMLWPFSWLVFSSLKTPADIVRIPPRLLPETWTLDAYRGVFGHYSRAVDIPGAFLNSIVVGVATVLSVLFTSSLGGYVFARLQFPGRDFLFYFVLSTTMVPFLTLLIPLYIVMDRLSLLNSLWGLVIPSLFSSFGIFLCRQFVYGIPSELYDAAKIDGAGDFTIYTRIILGMMKPVLSVLAIFAFRASFNDYLWPLVAITDDRKYTLPLALRGMQVTFGATEYHLVMAGSMLATIPPIIIFVAFQRNLVRGVALTGLKG